MKNVCNKTHKYKIVEKQRELFWSKVKTYQSEQDQRILLTKLYLQYIAIELQWRSEEVKLQSK